MKMRVILEEKTDAVLALIRVGLSGSVALGAHIAICADTRASIDVGDLLSADGLSQYGTRSTVCRGFRTLRSVLSR